MARHLLSMTIRHQRRSVEQLCVFADPHNADELTAVLRAAMKRHGHGPGDAGDYLLDVKPLIGVDGIEPFTFALTPGDRW